MTRSHIRTGLLALALAAAVAVLDLGAVASAARQPRPTVIATGHVDVASQVVDGRLVTSLKDTSKPGPVVYRDLADVVLVASPASAITVPAGLQYEFLGKPGARIWLLPQTQDQRLLWPGWSTEEIAADALDGGVTWRIGPVRGTDGTRAPGRFVLFETDSFGGTRILLDPASGADRMTIPVGVHVHGSWAFTARGVYCLPSVRSARLASGRAVTSKTVITVAVGGSPKKVRPADCATAGKRATRTGGPWA